MADPILSNLFETNHYAIKANTEGISDADAWLQPPAGNCICRVIGHIASSREGMLKVLGEPGVLAPDVAARYKRGSGTLLPPLPRGLPHRSAGAASASVGEEGRHPVARAARVTPPAWRRPRDAAAAPAIQPARRAGE